MDRTMPIRLANDHIALWLDPGSGRIMALHNVARNLDLVQIALDTPPWRLELGQPGEWVERFTDFFWEVEQGPGGSTAILRWETAYDLVVASRITVPPAEAAVYLTLSVQNHGPYAVDKVEYPIIAGIGPLAGRQAPACLAHSQGTGFLFHDPWQTFLPEPGLQQGLRYSPYPEGFNGSTMQFMAYYADGQGGFYFATRDGGKGAKWYNFFKDVETKALTASIMHQNPHVAPGVTFEPDYPVEISALVEGNWYEAAERYRAWARQQAWTAQGPLAERAERARWLLEEVGICTFGINAAHDRSAWLDAFHCMAGTPVFHVLGANWPRDDQDYRGSQPGASLNEWFPARLSAENLETVRRNGDFWAPFEFDLLCPQGSGAAESIMAARQLLPRRKYSFDAYLFPFMCPATPLWHDFHVARDVRMMADHAPDSIYYDISANNVLMTCRARHHGHPPGGGQPIADAFARLFADTKAAVADTAGHYVPLGAEMISELTLPAFDYYQARAEGSPASSFEADFWRRWLVEGKVEKIPLFAYVYHEYGPLRLDGWAKLSPEVGDIFYWVGSRVTLWGGLFELNYEFSGLELLDGQEDDPDEHYYQFEPRPYRIDPDKAAFVAEMARARTGWANPYLAYGTMVRPPHLEVPSIRLDYFLYNCGRNLPQYEERGTRSVSGVVCAAWNYRGERAALLFVNLEISPQTVTVPVELAQLGLEEARGMQLFGRTDGEETALGRAEAEQVIPLVLPPRRVVGLEIRPA